MPLRWFAPTAVGAACLLAACTPPPGAANRPVGNRPGNDADDEKPAWVTSERAGPASRCERRLTSPARTVLEQPCGTPLAVLTDGAYTIRLEGGERTFTEANAAAPVTTRDWVHVLPAPFAGVVNPTIKNLIVEAARDPSPDLLALSMQYLEGAPAVWDGNRQIAGDADYGPLSAAGVRSEGSDFYDYLGEAWTFADGVTERPMPTAIRSLDCSGFMRMLWGMRAGLPLASTAAAPGATAIPRRAVQMAAGPFGIAINPTPDRDQGLQAGDSVFFDADPLDGPAIDHVGMYLGMDAKGFRRFISSRKGANGPTLGDVRGASILDGVGLYAKGFRSARRW